MVELKVMDKLPKCEDGRACNGENDGFIILNCYDPKTGQRVLKAFCYPCYKAAEKERDQVMLQMYGNINKVE